MNTFELAQMIQDALVEAQDVIGIDEVIVTTGTQQVATVRINLLNGQRFGLVLTEIHG